MVAPEWALHLVEKRFHRKLAAKLAADVIGNEAFAMKA
jgi:hypothetical protein